VKKVTLILALCLALTAKGDITHETLERGLHRGMTYSAVCAILGRKARCERSEDPEGTTMQCSFNADDFGIVICEFQDNQLVKVLDMLNK
jgi:hypothetical protein